MPRVDVLSTGEIRMAISVITGLHEDVCAKVRAGELQSDYGQRIFENAQRLTGISETKLRELWDEWLANDGKTAPKCYAN